jgi:hypothetical protein
MSNIINEMTIIDQAHKMKRPLTHTGNFLALVSVSCFLNA